MVRVKLMFVLLQALGWALFLAIAYVARPSEDSVLELLQLAGVVAMSICGLLGSLALRLSGGRGLCMTHHGRAQGSHQQCYPSHHHVPAPSVDEGQARRAGTGLEAIHDLRSPGGRMVVVEDERNGWGCHCAGVAAPPRLGLAHCTVADLAVLVGGQPDDCAGCIGFEVKVQVLSLIHI